MTKKVHHQTKRAADRALERGGITEQAHAAILAGEMDLTAARNIGAEDAPTDATPDSGGRGTAPEIPGRASTGGADIPPRRCLCGCAGIPKGKKSLFIIGHDARLRSELSAQIRKGDVLLRSERITPEQRAFAVRHGLIGEEALPTAERPEG